MMLALRLALVFIIGIAGLSLLTPAHNKTKLAEITIETDRVLFISSPRKVLGWCDTCGARSEMVPVDEAAALARVNSRTIFRWVEAERLHASETPQGSLLVCLNSLRL